MVDLPIYSNQKTMIFHRFFMKIHEIPWSHHKPNTVHFPWKTRFVQTPVVWRRTSPAAQESLQGPHGAGPFGVAPGVFQWAIAGAVGSELGNQSGNPGDAGVWSLVETWVYLAEVCKRLLGSIPRKCWFEWENIMEIYDIYIYIYRAEFLQDFNLWRHWNDGLYIGKTPMMVK